MKLANLFITQSYLFIAFEPFLFLSTFSVFLKSFNIYFFQMTCLQISSMLTNCTMWSSYIFSASICFTRLSWSKFFRVQVFQSPGFLGTRFYRVQVFLVQVQCLGPGFRSSFKKGVFKNFATFTGKHLCWSFFLIKFLSLSEADQSFLQKEPAEFLQPEEISFQLLNNLHYIDKFYLEAHRLFHPSTRQHTF